MDNTIFYKGRADGAGIGLLGDGLWLCLFYWLLLAIKFVLWTNFKSLKLLPITCYSDLVAIWTSKFIVF